MPIRPWPIAARILRTPPATPQKRLARYWTWFCDALFGTSDRQAVSRLGIALRPPPARLPATPTLRFLGGSIPRPHRRE